MTTISAKVVADSISTEGIRLTTLLCRYPRFIHAEFMTHRVFSRNASSSRAIPVKRLIESVMQDTAMPIYWGRNQPGMQAGEDHHAKVENAYGAMVTREQAWIEERDRAVRKAEAYDRAGYHKQIVNRLLEPFSHITVVVTATEWSNFFALRRHPDAEPHMHLLADRMFEAMEASKPELRLVGEWHLPFAELESLPLNGGHPDWDLGIRLSVARCARTSYLTHEGKPPVIEDDLALYDRLVGAVPLHASPAEHQATPDDARYDDHYDDHAAFEGWSQPELHGNLRGWIQYRKTLPGESQ